MSEQVSTWRSHPLARLYRWRPFVCVAAVGLYALVGLYLLVARGSSFAGGGRLLLWWAVPAVIAVAVALVQWLGALIEAGVRARPEGIEVAFAYGTRLYRWEEIKGIHGGSMLTLTLHGGRIVQTPYQVRSLWERMSGRRLIGSYPDADRMRGTVEYLRRMLEEGRKRQST